MSHLPSCTCSFSRLSILLLPTSESEPSVIGVCGCDSRPNPGEWEVLGITMNGLRELDELVSVI